MPIQRISPLWQDFPGYDNFSVMETPLVTPHDPTNKLPNVIVSGNDANLKAMQGKTQEIMVGELVMSDVPCTHLDQIREVTPNAQGCEECLKMGAQWVHLRICLICGHVGCCDNSVNKHATKHYHTTHHPLIQSFEKGEDWIWCYVDNLAMEPGRILYRSHR